MLIQIPSVNLVYLLVVYFMSCVKSASQNVNIIAYLIVHNMIGYTKYGNIYRCHMAIYGLVSCHNNAKL